MKPPTVLSDMYLLGDSVTETKLGLKALKDLGDIGNKQKGLKDLKDKNSK